MAEKHCQAPGLLAYNPRPQFGWFVKLSAISIIALVLVAALRTSFSFGLSAFVSLNRFLGLTLDSNVLLVLSGVEALAAVLGIEGFIVTAGMKDGMRKNEDELTTPRAIASYILLAVSCIAGLFQNATLITGNEATLNTVEWVLMIVTGLGVPIAIMFASPYLGLMLNFQFLEEKRWLQEARRVFDSSKERKLARMDLINAQRKTVHVEEHHAAEKVVRSAEVVAWYRKLNNLSPTDALSASDVANAYFQASGRAPVNGDFARLSQAIRTHLSRERNQ